MMLKSLNRDVDLEYAGLWGLREIVDQIATMLLTELPYWLDNEFTDRELKDLVDGITTGKTYLARSLRRGINNAFDLLDESESGVRFFFMRAVNELVQLTEKLSEMETSAYRSIKEGSPIEPLHSRFCHPPNR